MRNTASTKARAILAGNKKAMAGKAQAFTARRPARAAAAVAASRPAKPSGRGNSRHHIPPLAILGAAVAGGLCGLLLVMNFYSGGLSSLTARQQQDTSLATASAAMPLPLPAAPALPSSQVTVISGKSDMNMPLLTRFASLSTSSVINDTPLILQASLSVDEPASGTAEILKSPPPEPVDKTFTLKKGETLAGKLVDMGVNIALASALVEQLQRVYPLRKIRPGTRFVVTLEQQPDFSGMEVTYPVYLSFSPRPGQRVVVETDDEGQFIARLRRDTKGESKTRLAGAPYRHVRGRISSSLYAAARDHGVPGYIISQMLRALSHQVDLQRQIKKGDTFEILYGKPFSGTSSRRYVLHYAALTLSGRKIAFYRYTTPDGKTAYYDSKGRSARRGLMRTPISGARISSGFGMRRHPVLGYTKMHTGVDFAAPTGTPIHAAGPGVVIHAGWRGGYGRTVMIKHPTGHVTLYAHQSRIARGIKKGVRVRQGQVIGYVGATGRVTGPHLHFEVRVKGRPINPLRVRTANRRKLKGKALEQFRRRMARINQLLEKVPVTTQIARK